MESYKQRLLLLYRCIKMRTQNSELFLMQEEELNDFLWDNASYKGNAVSTDENRIPGNIMQAMSDSLFGDY